MEQTNDSQSKASLCQSKTFLTISAIIIIAILVCGGTYAWQSSLLKDAKKAQLQQISALQNQIQQLQQENNTQKELLANVQNSAQPITQQTEQPAPQQIDKQNVDTTNVIDYKNDMYSFSLKFPQSWKGFTVAKTSEGETGIRITFADPTKHCDFPILLNTIKDWEDCKAEKAPATGSYYYWCGRELGRNEKYVFHPATEPPDCTEKLRNEASAIISTFELLKK